MLRTLLLIVTICIASSGQAEPHWRFEDRFSSAEKEKLQNWIMEAEDGMQTLFGSLPYRYSVHFYRSQRGKGPSPWAHTDKRRGRAVHFHVNTNYSSAVFKKDWTASHELSHLMFPYLGREGKWFAEGLASYLQYQIMSATGTISWKQAVNKLEERFYAARSTRDYENLSIIDLSMVASHKGPFVRLYWGGAAYFLNADKALYEKTGKRLSGVIAKYLQCCVYNDSESVKEMIAMFDQISETQVFSTVYNETVRRKGFPETATGLKWLRLSSPELLQ
jgi:hypothetical protein